MVAQARVARCRARIRPLREVAEAKCSRVVADDAQMRDVHVSYHPNATLVVLVAANGDYWLWFTIEPDHEMVSEILSGTQLADALGDGRSDSEVKAYLESRMRAAGYQLQPSSIEGRDLAVWRIRSNEDQYVTDQSGGPAGPSASTSDPLYS
jgi:hypothetical protein